MPSTSPGIAAGEPNRTGNRGRYRNTIVALALLAALAAYGIYRFRDQGFDWSQFAGTFRDVNWFWLCLSVPAIILTYLGRAIRWVVMVRPLKAQPSLRRIFEATCIGFTAIVFFGRAGELVRPYLIASQEKLPFSSQVAAWLLERILDLMMVLIIFGLALAGISHSGVALGPKTRLVFEAGGAVIGIAGAACLIVLLMFRYMSETTHRRLLDALAFLPPAYREKIDRFLAAFVQGMGSTKSNSFTVQLLAWSALEWAVIGSCFACLFRAFPPTQRFSLTDVVIFLGFVSLGAAIQIPGIGGGIQVASILVLTEIFHLPLATATGLAIVIWIISFVVIVPLGAILAFRQGLQWGRLSRISDEDSAQEVSG